MLQYHQLLEYSRQWQNISVQCNPILSGRRRLYHILVYNYTIVIGVGKMLCGQARQNFGWSMAHLAHAAASLA